MEGPSLTDPPPKKISQKASSQKAKAPRLIPGEDSVSGSPPPLLLWFKDIGFFFFYPDGISFLVRRPRVWGGGEKEEIHTVLLPSYKMPPAPATLLYSASNASSSLFLCPFRLSSLNQPTAHGGRGGVPKKTLVLRTLY